MLKKRHVYRKENSDNYPNIFKGVWILLNAKTMLTNMHK